MDKEYLELALAVLTGLATAIPLVIKLVEYVQKAIKERNWNVVLNMLMGYMETAESMFDNGADRKQWVMAMIKASADQVDYDIDYNVISDLIDKLCAMSKKVNYTSEMVGAE